MLENINKIKETIVYYDNKILSHIITDKKSVNTFFKLGLILLLFHSLLIFSSILFLHSLLSIFILLFFSSSTMTLYIIFSLKKIKNKEKIDQNIISNSIKKTNFIIEIKNNLTFNQKIASYISSFIFLYHIILIFFPFLFSDKINIFPFIITDISIMILILLAFHISFLIFYFKNRDLKYVFSQNQHKNLINKNLFIILLSFLLSYIILFIIFSLFLNHLLLIVLINFILSAFLTFIIKYIIDQRLYRGRFHKRPYTLKNYILKTTKLVKKIQIKDFIDVIKIMKFFYPLVFAFIWFIFISIFDQYLTSTIKLKIFQSFIIGLFFSYPVFHLFSEKDLNHFIKHAFQLTSFIFSIFFILSLLIFIKIPTNFQENTLLSLLQIFITPLFQFITTLQTSIHSFILYFNILTLLLLPIYFIFIFFINYYVLHLLHNIGRVIDFKLRKELTKMNPSIIFGDSLSLYPVLFSAMGHLIIIVFLFIEIKPFALFFSDLFITFKVTEVFKFQFLNESNLISFFHILLLIYTIFIILQHSFKILVAFSSHFILFHDEIVYYENKLINKSILRIPIKKINTIMIKQNILEKLFNLGTIYIETLNKNNTISISGISSIKEKNILIMDKIKSGL